MLFRSGVCPRIDRAIFGQQAGAVAVIMINNATSYPPYEDVIPGVTIPFLGLKSTQGAALVALDGTSFSMAATSIANPGYRQPASFTSSGPRNQDAGVKPDLSAPGVSVYSVAVGSGNDYTVYSGTSMAAPHVAGIAALVKGAHPSWSAQNIKNVLVSTASTDMAAINSMYPGRIIGNGMVDAQAALNAQVAFQATKAGDAGLSFGVNEGEDLNEEATIRLNNLTDHRVTVDLSAAISDGAELTVKPSHVSLKPGVNKIEVEVSMSEAAVAATEAFPSDTSIPTVIGSITASIDSVTAATMQVHVIQYSRSELEAKSSHHSSSIRLENEGAGYATADFYEWLVRDGRDAGAYYDFRALGAQYFPSPDGPVVVMALNAYNKFNNGAEVEYDVYIDNNGDGAPDVAVFALDWGLVVDGYTDGHMGVFIYDFATGAFGGYHGSAPLDGSTVFFPMLASDLGLTEASPIATILGIDTYSIYNDGGIDSNLTNATFNPFDPQRSTGDWVELAPGERAVVPTGSRAATAHEMESLGWMVVAQNNHSGRAQARLIHDENHDDD